MLDKSSDTPGFTARAAVIAVVLSLFLLASSTYIAVKIGALPWPIVFSVIVSGGIIKLLNRRRPVNIHEINVAQAGASIGGLIAAGIAFTVPGILFLNQSQGLQVDWPNPWLLGLLTALAALLGVLLSIPLKQTFIDQEQLPYPAGTAGAELLKLGKTGGSQMLAIVVFGAAAALFALLRDVYFPAGLSFPALAALGFFIVLYPMPLAISAGYILGPRASLSWFGGAALGWLLIVPLLIGNQFEVAAARSWIQNLGMGMVLGSGIGFFFTYIIPRLRQIFGPLLKSRSILLRLFPLFSILGLFGLLLIGVPFFAAFLTVIGVWMMVTVAARMTGETNINPLEQFGIFIGLVIAFIYHLAGLELGMFASFMIVAFVSVATAVAGDAGHDFKSAAIVGTRFRDIIKVDLIAAAAAGFAAPLVLESLRSGFAGSLFTDLMPAPQAKLVASSIFGFDYPGVFLSGFAIAFGGEVINHLLPARFRNRVMIMPLGIGLFLGLGLAIPIVLGALVRGYIDRNHPQRYHGGLLIAAGVMGGEGIAGFSAGALTTAGLAFTSGAYILMGVFGLVLLAALGIKRFLPEEKF